MKVFAVRQKSTGWFIPRLTGSSRRGGSYLEPVKNCSPRLFHSRPAARSFISQWCQGIFKNHIDAHTGEGSLDVVPQPHRKKEDMEIVEFSCYATGVESDLDALNIADKYGSIDGDHHKAWVIDQMVRALTGSDYDRWVAEHKNGEDGPETYVWFVGIAP